MKVGDRLDRLVAIAPADRIKGHRYWSFRCDCGTTLTRVPANIAKNKINACASCKRGSSSHAWKGLGEIPKDVFNTIYHGALARGVEFAITIDDLWKLYIAQDGRCAMTGWQIEFNATYREKKSKTASLDRIDSTQGYLPGNLQWVHRDVNKLKKNLPDERFIELCVAVAKLRG